MKILLTLIIPLFCYAQSSLKVFETIPNFDDSTKVLVDYIFEIYMVDSTHLGTHPELSQEWIYETDFDSWFLGKSNKEIMEHNPEYQNDYFLLGISQYDQVALFRAIPVYVKIPSCSSTLTPILKQKQIELPQKKEIGGKLKK